MEGNVPQKYAVIYADPPWTFTTYSRKGKGRSAEAHYDCMTYQELVEMWPTINQLAAKDCVLLMWATDPMLQKALSVIFAWGFHYKTVGFYWTKCAPKETSLVVPHDSNWPIGTGYWSRANPELCLLATRGKPRRQSAGVRKLIVAPRRAHSQKPEEAYGRIETLCTGPYLELFSRSQRDGWTCLGNEVQSGIGPRRWRSDGADL